MNITKVFVYVFLITISILSFYQGNKMKQEKNELDDAIKIGLEYEKNKLRWHLDYLSSHSYRNNKMTILKDSILQIIDTSLLFQKPFDQKYGTFVLSQLVKCEEVFNIPIKKGESNVSLISRAVIAYMSETYPKPKEKLAIYISLFELNKENKLLVNITPFISLNEMETKIYFKDSLIATSTPFSSNGDPKGLRLELTNPITHRISHYVY